MMRLMGTVNQSRPECAAACARRKAAAEQVAQAESKPSLIVRCWRAVKSFLGV